MIDLEKYYINQGDGSIKSMTFKNSTTLGKYGCGVCSFSMVVSFYQKIADDALQNDVVKEIVAKITNEDGNLVYGSFEKNLIHGKKYKCSMVSDIESQVKKGIPVVVQIPGHFVVAVGIDNTKSGYERILIKDPGKRANTNLKQALNDYKTNVIKNKFVLSLIA